MQFDMSENYLLWDNVETVSVTLKRSGGNTTISGITAGAGAEQNSDNEFGGAGTTLRTSNFNIPDSLLNPANNGREIRRGDLITDASGGVWYVNSAALVHNGSRWRCDVSPAR